MTMKINGFILIALGLSLFVFGCDMQANDIIQPGTNQTENGQTR